MWTGNELGDPQNSKKGSGPDPQTRAPALLQRVIRNEICWNLIWMQTAMHLHMHTHTPK